MAFLDMHGVNRPEVMIAQAHTKFDAAGSLADETACGLIREPLAALVGSTRTLKAA